MNKPPAFLFYPDNFIEGTAHMTAAEVGAYIRLLCYQWNNGSIPTGQTSRINRVAGISVKAVILEKFPGGKNPRLERERQKQLDFRELQAKKGTASAQARLNRASTPVEPRLNSGCLPVPTEIQPSVSVSVSSSGVPSTHVPSTRTREGELGLAAPDNDVNRSPRAVAGSAGFKPPTWEEALALMAVWNDAGGGFTIKEVRQAFVTLEERGWTRSSVAGERVTQDWRSSLEKQIGYDRDRKETNAKHPQRHTGNGSAEDRKPLSSKFICDNNNPAHAGPLIQRFGNAKKRAPAEDQVATEVHPDSGARSPASGFP